MIVGDIGEREREGSDEFNDSKGVEVLSGIVRERERDREGQLQWHEVTVTGVAAEKRTTR